MFAAALAPMAAAGQVNPDAGKSSEQGAGTYKYEVYGGFAYTSLNQVNESRYGLIGGKGQLTRDWGKYFGLMGAVDYFREPLISRNPPNPGDPSVYTFLVGPEIHANLYEKLSGEAFAELGGEHTGGEGMTPSISFAGGFGGGMTYNLTDRWAVRASGDRVGASFSFSNNTSQLAYSTHRTWNARATFGVVYRF
jgi:hypothetical protein